MARDDQVKPECSLAIMTPQLNMVKSASNPSVVNSFVSKFPVNSANKKFDVDLAAKTNSIIWHAKLGHPSAIVLHKNGVSERKHRHVVETELTLLAHANLPLRFWAKAFETATFLINNLPSSVLNFMSPFEKLFSRKPNYAFLKTFGCSCFPYLRYYSKHKFDIHSAKCIFLGYSMSHKGYKCLHPSGKVYVSRHVVFNETEFPYPLLFSTKVSSQMSSASLPIDVLQNASTSLITSVIPCYAPLAHSPHASGTISNSSDVDSPPLSTTAIPSGIELPTAVAQPTLPGPNHSMMTRTRTGTIAQKRYTLTPQVFTSTHSPAPSPEPKNLVISWSSAKLSESQLGFKG
ncbi:hypothetical protein EZV62_012622 [Acer yangbiense]|uniref:Retroviral polymerase SH3-like domain-containing protein n=1 Tax=Acer yangbiense TaxID=1000413 RepID=A0A5C7HX43_9ROSI|nr:hypothetical protein EZV62_012622 [Acer yangbiense]